MFVVAYPHCIFLKIENYEGELSYIWVKLCLLLEASHSLGTRGCFCLGKLVGECDPETRNAHKHVCLDVLRFQTPVDITSQF
jgi:hypothetical protein